MILAPLLCRVSGLHYSTPCFQSRSRQLPCILAHAAYFLLKAWSAWMPMLPLRCGEMWRPQLPQGHRHRRVAVGCTGKLHRQSDCCCVVPKEAQFASCNVRWRESRGLRQAWAQEIEIQATVVRAFLSGFSQHYSLRGQSFGPARSYWIESLNGR